MTRPTLQNGDIWTPELANSSGFPILDGDDTFGHGDLIVDDWLSGLPTEIKTRFYTWFNRGLITASIGLNVDHESFSVVLGDGTVVNIAAGSLLLPASSTVFIYVSDDGTVTQSEALPNVSLPLAVATTNGTDVAELADIREQARPQVGPVAPPDSFGFRIGDIKETVRTVPEPGWVLFDGTLYTSAEYPLGYAEIGTLFSEPGDPAGTFRAGPADNVSRTVISPDSNHVLGETYGSEEVTITLNSLTPHSHVATPSDHTHGINEVPHTHAVNVGQHTHGVYATYQFDDGATDSLITKPSAVAGEDRGTKAYVTHNGNGVQILANSSMTVEVLPKSTGLTTQPASGAVPVSSTGGGEPLNVLNPSVTLSRFIRVA